MNINTPPLAVLVKLLAFLIVLLAVIGGVTHFSNVPYWDMWDGYLGFYSHILLGDYSVWWDQHNEHRTVLSNALFWLTFKLFNGHTAFLIIVNYFLVLLSSYIFYLFLSKITSENGEVIENKGVYLSLLVSLLFFWSQKENLTWAFQSQFFLAFNIPLASFYFLSKYLDKKNNFDFSLSILFGLLSVGTMANGVLTLPLLVVFALFFKIDLKRLVIVSTLSILALTAYFYDYHSPENHSSVTQTLLHEPILIIRYVMRYIGSPLFHIVNGGPVGAVLAEIFGGLYILLSIKTALVFLKDISIRKYQTGLLFFVLYVGGTALGSAGGRVVFGLDQAFSNRYTTPALMAWVALLILNYYVWNRISRKTEGKFTYAVLFFIGVLFIRQSAAAFPNTLVLFERKVAALSVELGVKDQVQVAQIGRIYPSAEALHDISSTAIEKNLNIFSDLYIKDSKQRMNSEFIIKDNYVDCIGSLDIVREVNDEYYVLRGWIFEPNSRKVPKRIVLVENNKVVGFSLVGAPRRDVEKAIDANALFSGFKGYLLTESKGNISAYSEQEPFCKFNFPEIVTKG